MHVYQNNEMKHHHLYFQFFSTSPLLPTMVPKNESYVDIIGEGQSASFLDFQIVNAMYQCSGIPL